MKGEASQYPNLFVLSCYPITMLGASCGSGRNSLSFGILVAKLVVYSSFLLQVEIQGRRKNGHTAVQGRLHRTNRLNDSQAWLRISFWFIVKLSYTRFEFFSKSLLCLFCIMDP